MAPESKKKLQLSGAYRKARTLTSVLCAIGLGWSAAQFEVKSLSLGSAGSVDLTNASISLVLGCSIVYMIARCVIEFAMQPDKVRQWKLAQTDFRLNLFLVQAALLMLAAGDLNRSVDTVIYVAIGTVVIISASLLLAFITMMALTPLMIFIRARQGRYSVSSRVFEALAWSELIVLVLVIIFLIAFGIASLNYEPLHSLWTVPPSPISIGIFVATAIAFVTSLKLQQLWEGTLFARPVPYTETKMPDGTTSITFHHNLNGEKESDKEDTNN